MKKYICYGIAVVLLAAVFVIAIRYEREKNPSTAKREGYPEFEYNGEEFDITGKDADTLYAEANIAAEIYDEGFANCYIKDGTLFIDEYVYGDGAEEQVSSRQIAEDVVSVNYTGTGESDRADTVYLTKDHVLMGTGKYEELRLEEVKYFRAYQNQLIALKLDGSVWCKGKIDCLSKEETLEYDDWQMVLEDAKYVTLGHMDYMAVTKDDSLYMWGDNSFGQFGDGSLLHKDSAFDADREFYNEPVKVADDIKMVWDGIPGKESMAIYRTWGLRTWFLTKEDELFVCRENVGEEEKHFSYLGELGDTADETVTCTSELHYVKYQ